MLKFIVQIIKLLDMQNKYICMDCRIITTSIFFTKLNRLYNEITFKKIYIYINIYIFFSFLIRFQTNKIDIKKYIY